LHHLAWTFHTNAECRLQLQAEGKTNNVKLKGKGGQKGKKARWMKTLAAICDDFSDDEEDERRRGIRSGSLSQFAPLMFTLGLETVIHVSFSIFYIFSLALAL
jgi:hypothetical protein